MLNEEAMLEKIRELEEPLALKEAQVGEMEEFSARNRHLGSLLNHLSRRTSLHEIVDEKEKIINSLKHRGGMIRRRGKQSSRK